MLPAYYALFGASASQRLRQPHTKAAALARLILGDELDARRALELRQSAAAVVEDGVGGEAGGGVGHDERQSRLAPPLVGAPATAASTTPWRWNSTSSISLG